MLESAGPTGRGLRPRLNVAGFPEDAGFRRRGRSRGSRALGFPQLSPRGFAADSERRGLSAARTCQRAGGSAMGTTVLTHVSHEDVTSERDVRA